MRNSVVGHISSVLMLGVAASAALLLSPAASASGSRLSMGELTSAFQKPAVESVAAVAESGIAVDKYTETYNILADLQKGEAQLFHHDRKAEKVAFVAGQRTAAEAFYSVPQTRAARRAFKASLSAARKAFNNAQRAYHTKFHKVIVKARLFYIKTGIYSRVYPGLTP